MKASLQTRMDLGLIPTLIRKFRRKIALTLSGKKSKIKRNVCLCQVIEFQRLLETTITGIQYCTILKKMEVIQSLKAIFIAQAQTCLIK